MEQRDLLVLYPLKNVGNSEPPLLTMVERFQEKKIILPDFQRGPVWKSRKIREWIKSVIDQTAIGVVVTYQLQAGSPIYLADGLQRLTASMKFLESPSDYGFEFGSQQAREYCENFSITVQHRHYENHWAAMKAFHNLNSGTPLTPAEYFKGELCLDQRGEIVYQEVPNILGKYEISIVPSTSPTRPQKSALLRDGFALFLQFISGTTTTNFWNVASSNTTKGVSVETRIREYFEKQRYSTNEVETDLQKFENFLAGQIRLLQKMKQEMGRSDQPINRTTLRRLLHLAIWRKNTRTSAALHEKFIKAFLTEASSHATFGSRSIMISRSDGTTDSIAIKVGSLMPALKDLGEYLEIPLHEKQSRKKGQTIKGDHRSHREPFSLFGEGETFNEPAPRNLSRGAKSVE